MKKIFIILFALSGCIGTDILDDMMEPQLTIQTQISTLKVGDSFHLEARYLNEVGDETDISIIWVSCNSSAITVDQSGLLTAKSEGQSIIKASANGAMDSLIVMATDTTTVTMSEERQATIKTSSSYPLSGTAILRNNESGGLDLEFSKDFSTTSALPGLYVYLSNNTNTTNGALEVGAVTKFSGQQTYSIPAGTDLFQYEYVLFYCKPFVVPVGHGKLNP